MNDGSFDKPQARRSADGTRCTMRLRTSLCLGLAALALAACGDDDAAKPLAASTTAGGGTVTIGLRDYAFDGVPATITSRTRIAATNTSTDEAHELTAFRLPDDETRSVAELQGLPPEELGALLPGVPVLAIVAAPGEAGQVVLGGATLPQPGRYLLVCFVPMGAKPDEVVAAIRAAAANPDAGPPQIAGGPPHLTAGMIADLEVTP